MTHLQHFQEEARKQLTRRWFFKQCGVGLGSMALGSLVSDALVPSAGAAVNLENDLQHG